MISNAANGLYDASFPYPSHPGSHLNRHAKATLNFYGQNSKHLIVSVISLRYINYILL